MAFATDEPTIVRKLRRHEQTAFEAFLVETDPETRRTRFLGFVGDAFVREHAARAFASGAVIHGAFSGGALCGVAELHPAGSDGKAEAAFLVASHARRRGLGTALFDATVLAARNRGCRAVRISCLRGNWPMRRLAAKSGAKLSISLDEIEAEITPPPPTMLSLFREVLRDAPPVLPLPIAAE